MQKKKKSLWTKNAINIIYMCVWNVFLNNMGHTYIYNMYVRTIFFSDTCFSPLLFNLIASFQLWKKRQDDNLIKQMFSS